MSKAVSDSDVTEIMQMIASNFLHVSAVPLSTAPVRALPARWSGLISLHGGFDGSVQIECSADFARKIAGEIYEAKPDDSTAYDLLAELTNIVGGNIKSLIATAVGAECRLSLPVVAPGKADASMGTVVSEMWCSLGGDPVRLLVLRGAA